MSKGVNRGLPIARLLMVVSSLAPLFLLWALRGAPSIPDKYWIAICLGLAAFPNLALSLMPLLPVRSTSCKGEAGARRRCRGGIGMRHGGCAGD